jgi:hypothetical protein
VGVVTIDETFFITFWWGNHDMGSVKVACNSRDTCNVIELACNVVAILWPLDNIPL